MKFFACIVTIILLLAHQRIVRPDDYRLPDIVTVLPVTFVPSNETLPSRTQRRVFLNHVKWAQRRYRELLHGDTFALAKQSVSVVRGSRKLEFYKTQPENAAPDIVAELLAHFEVSRFENPHVFCILVANSRDEYPVGGGRPINGGMNSGGGMMFVSSFGLNSNKHFQTTLQHELGHSFGLAHVNVYGYDMKSNASMMSYNPAHFTDGFKPSGTPGILNPEDLRVLAINNRVFANTTFSPERDTPAGYKLSPRFVPLGPMTLPGHPDFYPTVTTDAGEDVRSSVSNVVQGWIKPSAGPGITYDARNMWHSLKEPRESATLEFSFPFEITATSIAIHSQHSGIGHEATAMSLDAVIGDTVQNVIEQPLESIDAVVAFPQTRARKWKLQLKTGKSGILVIRGIRFLHEKSEVVPHMIPYINNPSGAAS
ncbi:MAG: hypothetical protein ACI8P0_003400 [Planctomycetaceae bacterium]|jgi:hypothetical protein